MPEEPRVRDRYSRRRVQTPGGGKTMTKQDGREEGDVNFIINRMAKTGVTPEWNLAQPRYGDVSEVRSLRDMYEVVSEAREQFMTLASGVRAAAQNNEYTFLEMLETEEGQEALITAGLELIDDPNAPSEPEAERAAQPAGADTEPPNGGDSTSNP